MPEQTLEQRVVAAALEAGASSVRIASAQADSVARARMQAAFARDDYATWGYDAKRADDLTTPQNLLPGAAAVVCIAVAYAAAPPRRAKPLSGRVSRYAWSVDYHTTVRRVLRRVAEVLDAAAQTSVSRIACDTAPIAERAYAVRAGLGWFGKHTNLIAPGIGSYVFLGEVVTTTPLRPDEPLRKTCGSCARCVSVCPTGALRGDDTIDARRCIADLTQRVDGIPREWRAFVGDWLWGCDLCQDVCPPTQRAPASADPHFAPIDEEAAFPDLQRLLHLRSGTFKRRFAKTAMGWRGAAVLRRNAAVALGNALDRAAIPALVRSLEEDPHPMVRCHVAWALGRIGAPAALAALRDRLPVESDVSVREEIALALEPFPSLAPLKRNV
ncbi:MAG TPA: tRNA epoxyqueuosine(34) reductase QueG [Candidatus Acidoferrales bacterium]|nr:tRNA epoxyqueuosine(34) reductase QueG [Candidatus Acidoferrales bacterium]